MGDKHIVCSPLFYLYTRHAPVKTVEHCTVNVNTCYLILIVLCNIRTHNLRNMAALRLYYYGRWNHRHLLFNIFFCVLGHSENGKNE